MRISHVMDIDPKKMNRANGYGYATERITESVTRLGHSFKVNDPDAPVEFWFDQPWRWFWRKDSYKIGYHPWESTRLPDGWVDKMNECDEVWTPSPLIAEWYAADGVKPPIHVYEHGVDKVWSPKKRNPDGKIRFLHVGAEAARKGGWDALNAFRKAFIGRDDVELTLKTVNLPFNIERVGKTNIINRKMDFSELQDLYYSHDVFVYPSWGEGFGLTPLQAMATGMPTICTGEWAPYERFIDPNLNIPSTLRNTQWSEIHPGKMLKPDLDAMIEQMRYVVDNYDDAHNFAMRQTEKIQVEYDWDSLTKNAFDKLADRL